MNDANGHPIRLGTDVEPIDARTRWRRGRVVAVGRAQLSVRYQARSSRRYYTTKVRPNLVLVVGRIHEDQAS